MAIKGFKKDLVEVLEQHGPIDKFAIKKYFPNKTIAQIAAAMGNLKSKNNIQIETTKEKGGQAQYSISTTETSKHETAKDEIEYGDGREQDVAPTNLNALNHYFNVIKQKDVALQGVIDLRDSLNEIIKALEI